MVRRLIGEDIRVLTELDESAGHALVDRSQLEQVILNLVVNARDAMPQGGVLGIATSEVDLDAGQAGALGLQPGRHVLLSVSDTGTGMDEATRARVFEPFFTTKEVGSGTGLGLATVRGIVEQSGGSVWVYSEPGLGSTFRVCLPCAAAEARADRRSVEVPLATLDGTETILLVEDEALVRAVARRALEERGYRVLEASTPAAALALASEPEAAIDLLVTDVIMPGMTGSDLVAALRPTRPELPVLYVSGYAQHMIFARGIVVDDASILEKPFTADLLARRVREVIQSHRR
jgi:CheY-like chemotaxis protein